MLLQKTICHQYLFDFFFRRLCKRQKVLVFSILYCTDFCDDRKNCQPVKNPTRNKRILAHHCSTADFVYQMYSQLLSKTNKSAGRCIYALSRGDWQRHRAINRLTIQTTLDVSVFARNHHNSANIPNTIKIENLQNNIVLPPGDSATHFPNGNYSFAFLGCSISSDLPIAQFQHTTEVFIIF